MPLKPELDVFARLPRRLSTDMSGSSLTVSHTSSAHFDPDAVLGAASEDGFALVYRLSDMAEHDFWNDDGFTRVPPTARGTLQIVDLRGGARSRFESTFDNLHVSIPRSALAVLADQIGRSPARSLAVPEPWETRDPIFEALSVSLLRAFDEPDLLDPLVADHLLLALLAHVASTYGGMGSPAASMRGSLAPSQVERIKDLLSADPFATPAIADVARTVDMSPSHLSRAFRAATGLSPSAWLQQHRIQRAKDMLRGSSLPLVDVAIRSGFADQSHFTRTFSRLAGTSPGAWRRAHRRS
ncbi:helix-turn-helix transcriptional regulator [Sphingomonas sp. DT-51]|uniref:helix-turn-helix transcriptional regulator n=1 Tax=Sphingomonas sp. DT-51 TaxID=3396165 RepID=UPI003F1B8B6D